MTARIRHRWDGATFELHCRLIHARRERPWLNGGGWETLVADPVSNAYAYRRSDRPLLGALPGDAPEQSLWVALNPGPAPAEVELPLADVQGARLRDLLTDETHAAENPLRLSLAPYAAVVLAEERR